MHNCPIGSQCQLPRRVSKRSLQFGSNWKLLHVLESSFFFLSWENRGRALLNNLDAESLELWRSVKMWGPILRGVNLDGRRVEGAGLTLSLRSLAFGGAIWRQQLSRTRETVTLRSSCEDDEFWETNSEKLQQG